MRVGLTLWALSGLQAPAPVDAPVGETAPAVQGPTIQRPQAPPPVVEASVPPESVVAPEPEPAPEAEPAAEAETPVSAEPEGPQVPTDSWPAAGEKSVALEGSGDAWVDIMVVSEVDDRPQPGIRVTLWCEDCGVQPGFKTSQPGGLAAFRGVRAGTYLVVAYAPGGPVEGIVDVPANERVGVRLALPRDPYRPKDEKGRLNYPGFSSDPRRARAQVPLALGGVFLAAGVGLGIGAVVEALVPDCRYGNDACDGGPRPDVTRSMAIGAALSGAVGIAGITYGAIQYKRWRYGVKANSESASVVISGRF